MNAVRIYDAVSVELDMYRWHATILVQRADPEARPVEFYICADGEHSGLWVGDRADHEEH